MFKERSKYFLGFISIVVLFVLASMFVQENMELIRPMLDFGLFGMFIYLIVVIIAVVIAPISAFPLIPLASALWGWVASALLVITGWVIGAQIAFLLARAYGVPLIKKIVSLEQINKIEKIIPDENVFWGIVLLRMSIPVEVLSYALGLFSKISPRRYFLATVLGVTPFGIIFAYAGTVDFIYQMITMFSAGIIIFTGAIITILRR